MLVIIWKNLHPLSVSLSSGSLSPTLHIPRCCPRGDVIMDLGHCPHAFITSSVCNSFDVCWGARVMVLVQSGSPWCPCPHWDLPDLLCPTEAEWRRQCLHEIQHILAGEVVSRAKKNRDVDIQIEKSQKSTKELEKEITIICIQRHRRLNINTILFKYISVCKQ